MQFLEPGHLREQLRHDCFRDLRACTRAPARSQRIELVEKDYCWCDLLCAAEDVPYLLLGLADPFRIYLRSFDGYEVRPALVRDSACHEGLPATGRSVQEDALRRFYPYALEAVRVLQRPFDHFLQPLFDLLKAANIFPFDLRYFYKHLSHCARFHNTQCVFEIITFDDQLFHHISWQLFLFPPFYFRQHPAQRAHCRFLYERCYVRSHISVSYVSKPAEIYLFVKRHVPCMYLQNFQSSCAVWHRNLYFPVKPAAASQRRLDSIHTVRRSDDDYLSPLFQAVHQREQLRDHAPFHLACHLFALRCDRVYLVNENNRRRILFRILENLPQVLLALAIPLGHDFRAADGYEVRPALVRHCPRKQCLACAWRTVKQHAAWRLYTQPFEKLRMPQRQLNHLADLLDNPFHPADVLVCDSRHSTFFNSHTLGCSWLYLQIGSIGYGHHAFRLCVRHYESCFSHHWREEHVNKISAKKVLEKAAAAVAPPAHDRRRYDYVALYNRSLEDVLPDEIRRDVYHEPFLCRR